MNVGDARFGIVGEMERPKMAPLGTQNLVGLAIRLFDLAVWLDIQNLFGVKQHGGSFFIVFGQWSTYQRVHPSRGIRCVKPNCRRENHDREHCK